MPTQVKQQNVVPALHQPASSTALSPDRTLFRPWTKTKSGPSTSEVRYQPLNNRLSPRGVNSTSSTGTRSRWGGLPGDCVQRSSSSGLPIRETKM